jgi:chromosome segregation ATPase
LPTFFTLAQGTNWQASKFQYEASLTQLREAAEGEAAARRAAQAERAAAQAEAERLGGRVAELGEEVESLRDTVSHLGESLANALALGGEAAEDSIESGEFPLGGRFWPMRNSSVVLGTSFQAPDLC